jgi:hypothetical protein
MEFDFFTVGVIRVLVPLLILRSPLPGILLSAYIDWLDWRLLDLDHGTSAEQDFYQVWDKLLDAYYLAIALLVSLRWSDNLTRNIGLAFFGYRLIGVVLLGITGAQQLLFVFPNLFENYFVFFYLYRWLSGRELALSRRSDMVLVVTAILIPQLAREFLLHVIDDRPWDMARLLPLRELDVVLWSLVYLALPLAVLAYLLGGQRLRPKWRLLWSR